MKKCACRAKAFELTLIPCRIWSDLRLSRNRAQAFPLRGPCKPQHAPSFTPQPMNGLLMFTQFALHFPFEAFSRSVPTWAVPRAFLPKPLDASLDRPQVPQQIHVNHQNHHEVCKLQLCKRGLNHLVGCKNTMVPATWTMWPGRKRTTNSLSLRCQDSFDIYATHNHKPSPCAQVH